MHRSASPLLQTLVLCATLIACATGGSSAGSEPSEASVRLLAVDPPIGERIDPSTTIRVRAAYRIPEAGSGYHASLLFLTESGRLTAARGSRGVPLPHEAGVIELTGRASEVPGDIRSPLTVVVMVIAPPADDVTDNVSAEMNARLQQMTDSLSRVHSTAAVRVGVRTAPAVARSRAIFYNGAGPASMRIGPALPFDEALEEYRSYRGSKAFALAAGAADRRAWGYGFGYELPDSAIARALRECDDSVERRGMNARCRIHMIGNTVVEPEVPTP